MSIRAISPLGNVKSSSLIGIFFSKVFGIGFLLVFYKPFFDITFLYSYYSRFYKKSGRFPGDNSPLAPPLTYLNFTTLPVRLYGLWETPRTPVAARVLEVLHFFCAKNRQTRYCYHYTPGDSSFFDKLSLTVLPILTVYHCKTKNTGRFYTPGEEIKT